MNDLFNPNHIGDDSVPSTRITTQSSPPSLAPKTAQQTSLGRRLQRALTGGPNRRFPGLHSPLGGTASTSLLANRRLAFPVLALLAALIAGMMFLLPGGPLLAQDSSTIDYPENGTGPVATYTAVDPEGADIVWSVAGTDAGDFSIENGVLTFKSPPNFEAPKGGADGNSATYTVTVEASDGGTMMDTEEVTVSVTNIEEPGMITLSALQPQAGVDLMATLTDPDGTASGTMWQWERVFPPGVGAMDRDRRRQRIDIHTFKYGCGLLPADNG